MEKIIVNDFGSRSFEAKDLLKEKDKEIGS